MGSSTTIIHKIFITIWFNKVSFFIISGTNKWTTFPLKIFRKLRNFIRIPNNNLRYESQSFCNINETADNKAQKSSFLESITVVISCIIRSLLVEQYFYTTINFMTFLEHINIKRSPSPSLYPSYILRFSFFLSPLYPPFCHNPENLIADDWIKSIMFFY